MTPDDLRSLNWQSGYRNVQKIGGQPSRKGSAVYFQARIVEPGKKVRTGPGRKDPRDAAQDYCDWANGTGAPLPPALKTIKHKRPKRRPRPAQPKHIAEKREEVRKWDREVALPATQNYIYLIGIEGDRSGVKIGESKSPLWRAAEGQTWHHRRVVVLATIKTDIAKDADKVVHKKFSEYHIANEWFRPAREVLSYFGVSDATYFRKTAMPRRVA